MAWNANDASRQAAQKRLQQQQKQQRQQQQQQRFYRSNQQRAARQMSDLMAQYRARRSFSRQQRGGQGAAMGAGVPAFEPGSSSEPILDISAHEAQGDGLQVILPVGFDAIVGRAETDGVRIDDPEVSRRHARLVHDERGVIVQDLGSTNGTQINGDRITGPCLLRDGDVVSFGDVSAVFRSSSPAQLERGGPSAAGSDAGGESAGSGPLEPEAPIGEPPAEPSVGQVTPRPSDGIPGHPDSLRPGWSGEVRGTVLNVVQPVVNVNPWLVLNIRTDDGETVAVRGWFFWGAIRAPQVAEGHYVRVGGRLTHQGYIKPSYIINESTGSRWRRWV
jgi:hypothetical protein